MTHTYECSIAKASRDLQVAAYRMMWPQRCETCKGVGGFEESYDPSPSGVSLSPGSMMWWDPCPDCIGAEMTHCPRCSVICRGEIGDILVEDGVCMFCGWREDSNGAHEPPPYECGCEFEEMLEWEPPTYWRRGDE